MLTFPPPPPPNRLTSISLSFPFLCSPSLSNRNPGTCHDYVLLSAGNPGGNPAKRREEYRPLLAGVDYDLYIQPFLVAPTNISFFVPEQLVVSSTS